MDNHGQIYATDGDARRLAPIHERARPGGRAQRPGPHAARRAPTRSPDLDGKIDCVLVDAPCTGIGTWRRNPDAKWRLRPGSLEVRRNEQAAVLDRAARLVKPGGRIVYVTCSVLPEENDDAVAGLPGPPRRASTPVGVRARCWPRPGSTGSPTLVRATAHGLQMTPLADRHRRILRRGASRSD